MEDPCKTCEFNPEEYNAPHVCKTCIHWEKSYHYKNRNVINFLDRKKEKEENEVVEQIIQKSKSLDW